MHADLKPLFQNLSAFRSSVYGLCQGIYLACDKGTQTFNDTYHVLKIDTRSTLMLYQIVGYKRFMETSSLAGRQLRTANWYRLLRLKVLRGHLNRSRLPLISAFYTGASTLIQVAPQLSSRGRVDPAPVSLLLRKSESAGNRPRDHSICSQQLWPLDRRDDSRTLGP
jgi:hypothetical protein